MREAPGLREVGLRERVDAADQTRGDDTGMSPLPGRRSGLLVVGLLIAAGLAAGAVAYRQLVASEHELSAALSKLRQQGAGLTVDGCVDAVIDWHGHCDAMKSLCDQMVPRFMDACLTAADRGAYCAGLGSRGADTRFGVAECRARGGDRDTKKACAAVYRVIDGHCRERTGDS